MKRFIFMLAAVLVCTGLWAQKPALGIYGEYAPYIAKERVDATEVKEDEIFHEVMAGLDYRMFLFGKNLYAETGIGVGLMWQPRIFDNLYFNTNISCLRVPLKIGFDFGFKFLRLAPYAGVNLRFNCTAMMKMGILNKPDSESKFDMFNPEDDLNFYGIKRVQVGGVVGLRATFFDKIYISAAYAPDLTPIMKTDEKTTSVTGFQARIGYFF